MQSGGEINAVAHVIQQAVAPVFLLTGVGAMLGVLTSRLSRIIDRFRTLEAAQFAARSTPDCAQKDAEADFRRAEMKVLGRRRIWIHRAITLCTVCALLVCVVIATLFLGSEFNTDPSRTVGLLFITAMLSLICGLVCFLREIALATDGFESEELRAER